MARPKNPSAIQRMGVRRMYEQLPKLGIQFATPTYPFAMPAPSAVSMAAVRATGGVTTACRRTGGTAARAGKGRGVGGLPARASRAARLPDRGSRRLMPHEPAGRAPEEEMTGHPQWRDARATYALECGPVLKGRVHGKAQARPVEPRIRPIAFGGNVFGWTADEATSHKILDAFVDAGFSFIDTADVYSRWKPGNKGGDRRP